MTPLPSQADLDFRRIAELVPHLVWTCRGDGPCDYLSPQWVAYTGRPADEQLGYGWLEAIHPEDRQRTNDAWQAAVASRSELDIDFRIRRHDGVYRWFTTRAVPEVLADGTISRWYGTNTDTQDLRDQEAALLALHRELDQRVADRTADLVTTRVQLEMAQYITNMGSWSLDLRTQRLQWSDEMFRLFGLPVTEAGPAFVDVQACFEAESWRRFDAAHARAIHEGAAFEIEVELQPNDRGRRFAIARCNPARTEHGESASLFGTFQDVSELVRARHERDVALERMALATQFAGIGVWDWWVDDGTLTWNDEMYRLFDLPRDCTPSYEVWRNAVLPEDRADAERSLQDTVAGTRDFLSTYRIVQRDRSQRFIRATAKLSGDVADRSRRVVGICVDVTAEVLADQAEASRLAKLREFIRNAPAAIAMLDANVTYIEASRRWTELYALPEGSLVGRHHYDVFPEIPERWKEIHRKVLSGTVCRHPEDPFLRESGEIQYIAWEAHPWYDDEGRVGGMMFFNQDVTDSVMLRQRLEQQSRELQRSNDDLQQFAYAASHDLQEPLRAVAGFAQILGRRYTGRLDDDADVIIRHMTEGATRMRTLIDDLLTFSRVGSGNANVVTVPLRSLVDDALANIAHTVSETGAIIEVEELPTVDADRTLMIQLFQNLIGNSLKYAGRAAPRVRISGITHADHVEVRVRDWGIGVPPAAAERVFQIFQRLHTRDEYAGTGVGLALCRRIVERHGGSIRLTQPEDGAGCIVHFTLPANRGHDAER